MRLFLSVFFLAIVLGLIGLGAVGIASFVFAQESVVDSELPFLAIDQDKYLQDNGQYLQVLKEECEVCKTDVYQMNMWGYEMVIYNADGSIDKEGVRPTTEFYTEHIPAPRIVATSSDPSVYIDI